MQWKRVTGFVLSAAMLLTMLPSGAWAVNDGNADEGTPALVAQYFAGADGVEDTTVLNVAPDAAADTDAALLGTGAEVAEDGTLSLPGGAANSGAGYVELPASLFENQDELTISAWIKNDTGSGNYAAMYFGGAKASSSNYWLLNPQNPDGRLKSVVTDYTSGNSAYKTEYGVSPTTAAQGVAGPETDDAWHLYTTTITADELTAYYDDAAYGPVALSRPVSEFGSDLVAFIGCSGYPDPYFQGSVRDVRVYQGALDQEAVTALYNRTPDGGETEPPVEEPDTNRPAAIDTETGLFYSEDFSGATTENLTLANGAAVTDDALVLTGGNANTDSPYAALPDGWMDGLDTATISFDVKTETASGNFFTFTVCQDTTQYLFLRTEGNRFYTAITKSSNSGESFATASGLSALSQWKHVTLVFDNNQFVTYIDGVEAARQDASATTLSELGTGAHIWFGKSPWPDKYFAGSYDNIKLYSKALTADQVAVDSAASYL